MLNPSLSVTRYFRPLRDPRRNHRKKHLLMDIVVITLCAVIAGANDWQQVFSESFGAGQPLQIAQLYTSRLSL